MRTVTNRSAIVLVTSVLALGCCAPGQASARTFGGYDCTDNCVGHAAGYRWGEERGVENMDECPENRSVLEAEYVETLGHSGDAICSMLRDKGYSVEAQDAAQIMIYAWRA